MTFRRHNVPCLFALVIVAGCAPTQVTKRQILVNERMPRPDRILVYDFIADPADMPADSALAGQFIALPLRNQRRGAGSAGSTRCVASLIDASLANPPYW
jgi:hypothetical protein